MPSGIKPLQKLMLTQIYVAIWHHWATMNYWEILRRSLQWRHNEHDRRLKSPASRLFTRPFIQGADQRKYQSSTSLAFVGGIHWGLVNSLHKWPVTWKCFHLMMPLCTDRSPDYCFLHSSGLQMTLKNAFSWMKHFPNSSINNKNGSILF